MANREKDLAEIQVDQEGEEVDHQHEQQGEGHLIMVYNDTSFLKIREEFPNLEKEVRSLLLARAQDGATIAEIRGNAHFTIQSM